MTEPVPSAMLQRLRATLSEQDVHALLPALSADNQHAALYLRVLQDESDAIKFGAKASQLVQDVRKCESEPHFAQLMPSIWSVHLPLEPELDAQRDAKRPSALTVKAVQLSLLFILSKMSSNSAKTVVQYANQVGALLDDAVGAIVAVQSEQMLATLNNTNGQVGVACLVLGFLTMEVYRNWLRWQRSEIDSRRCVHNVFKSASAVVSAVLASVSCVPLLEGALGSVGVLFCGFLTASVVAEVAARGCERLTCFVFNLARDEEDDRAYRTLRLAPRPRCSDDELSSRLRQLLAEHHPLFRVPQETLKLRLDAIHRVRQHRTFRSY